MKIEQVNTLTHGAKHTFFDTIAKQDLSVKKFNVTSINQSPTSKFRIDPEKTSRNNKKFGITSVNLNKSLTKISYFVEGRRNVYLQ